MIKVTFQVKEESYGTYVFEVPDDETIFINDEEFGPQEAIQSELDNMSIHDVVWHDKEWEVLEIDEEFIDDN